MNWGWNGRDDGYYTSTDLAPTGTSYNFSYSSVVGALIGIQPLNSGLGVAKVAGNQPIHVYPNPSNGIFTLNYSLNNGGTVRTTVINELGQIVYDNTEQKNTGNITEQLNLENLAPGIYSLRIQTDNSIMVRKLVLMGR